MQQSIEISINQMMKAFSDVIDLSTENKSDHSRRTAYIALRLGRRLGLIEEEIQQIYLGALVHDFAQRVGEIYLKKGLKELLSLSVTEKHEEIIALAEYVDEFCKGNKEYYMKRKEVIEELQKVAHCYSADIVEGLLELLQLEAFWLDYLSADIPYILSKVEPYGKASITINELEEIGKSFALLIDKKSRYTHTHSLGVDEVAKGIANSFGFDEFIVRKIGIAALLHDIGKVVIPNEIIDKEGSLTENEFLQIKAHPYYTKFILGKIQGIEDIAAWAGNHHEKLDGTGYPEGLNHSQLTVYDQIIAVADMFQAMTEDRPYREGMAYEKALSILDDLVEKNKIEKEVVVHLKKWINKKDSERTA